jgi:hypothetical protein
MRLINATSTYTRIVMMLTAVFFILPVFMPTAEADMVVAPSTIISNTNTKINDDNYRNNRINDDVNTVKAIIGYNLGDCLLVQDPTDVRFWVSNEREVADGNYVEAISIRYCYVDDNLIVEFDREEITAYLEVLNVNGEIDVVVEGTFPVTCSGSKATLVIDDERSTMILSIKNSRK